MRFHTGGGTRGAGGMGWISAIPAPRAALPSPSHPTAGSWVSKHPCLDAQHRHRGLSSCRSSSSSGASRCHSAPREPGRPPRSPRATKIAAAPSQQWGKSSWNSNIASLSRGRWGADSAAARCARLGWGRPAPGINRRPHTEAEGQALRATFSSVTETPPESLCASSATRTHTRVHTDDHNLLLRFIQVFFSP